MNDLYPLSGLLARVSRRLRLQAAAAGAVQGGIVAASLSAIAISLHRAGLFNQHALTRWLAGAAGVVVVGLVYGACSRIRPLDVACRIDHTHALQDRFSSALQFHDAQAAADRDGTTLALSRLAIADAVRLVPTVIPAQAAPWPRPPHLGLLVALCLLMPLAAFLRLPHRAAPPPPPHGPAPQAARLTVEPEMLGPEREEIARLQQEALRTGDEELKEVAAALQKLLEQVERGELSRKEVFDQLSELEQRVMRARDTALEALKEKLRKAGAELGQDKLAKELGSALQKEDMEKAKRELERLAQQAMQRASQKERQELSRALDRAAQQSQAPDQWQDKTEAERRTAEEQRLKEEERRLKKKLEQNPRDEESVRRLQKVQRELERLQREKEDRAEAQRELERLQRDMQQAAEELRRQLDKMTPEQRKAMEQLAKDMSRMQDEIRKLQKQGGQGQGQGQGQAMVAIGSLKQVLRRMGRSGNGQQGQGQQGQGQGQAQSGQSGQGQGQDGKGGKGGQGKDGKGNSPMKDFLNRAKGQGDSDVLVEGEGGKGDQQMMILGEGHTPIILPGMGQQGPGPGPGNDKPAGPQDGIGNQHDPNLLGDPSQLQGKRRLTKVQGKQGAGPTRSETILGSAEKGFATRQYQKVYSDYQSVAEDVMSKERVPPGYRFYVKRYFQLIKPRE